METCQRGLAAALALLAGVVLAPLGVAATPPPAPLFAASDEIELTLTLPLRTLLRERSSRPDLKGTIAFTAASGALQQLDVAVTTRGRDRLARCSFPPLRLDFKRSQVPGTLFAEQDRLKLVTLCNAASSFERYLEIEQFVYRLYAELTDAAFRVRRVRMRYVDTERDNAVREAQAFFIESIDGVAERVGMATAGLPLLAPDSLDLPALTRVALFQFLIGNTDWAATAATQGEDCCHNADVLAPANGAGGFVLVPYDFDHAGIVDAEYAEPNPELGIRSVRERLYRGFCRANSHIEAVVGELNAALPAIEALLATLTPNARTAAASYVARSYEILNDPNERQRQILDRCRRG